MVLATAGLDAVGSALAITVLLLYAKSVLLVSAAQAAFMISAAGAAGFIAAWMSAGVIQTLGVRPVLVATNVARAVLSLSIPLVGEYFYVLVAVLAGQALGQWTGPAAQVFIRATFVDDDRVLLLAKMHVVRNAGFAVGGLIGAAILFLGPDHYRWAFFIDAATFLVAGLVALGYPPVAAPPAEDKGFLRSIGQTVLVFRDRLILRAAFGTVVLFLGVSLFEVALPLATAEVGLETIFAVAVVVNTIMVIAFQVPVTKALADRTPVFIGRISGALLLTCAALYAFSGVLDSTVALAALGLAALLNTVAELMFSTVDWTYLDQLGESPKQVSAWFAARRTETILGPPLAALVVSTRPWGLIIVAILLVSAGASLVRYVRPSYQRVVVE